MFILALLLIALLFSIAIVSFFYALSGSALGLCVFLVIIASVVIYFIADYTCRSKNKKRLLSEKQEKFSEFKAQGFKSTHQYKTGGNLFAIDQNSRRWFVMRYNSPKSSMLHRFEDIRGYERRENAQMQSIGTGAAATDSVGLASFVSQKVYTKLGVVVFLNDIKHPTEFISCMGNEDGVDEVLNILDIITKN